jgi:hypothetical protein
MKAFTPAFLKIAATVGNRTLERPPMQAAWDQALFRPFERYLFARFRGMENTSTVFRQGLRLVAAASLPTPPSLIFILATPIAVDAGIVYRHAAPFCFFDREPKV